MPDIKAVSEVYFKSVNDSDTSAPENSEVSLSKVKVKVVGTPQWSQSTLPIQTDQAQKVTVTRHNTDSSDSATVSTKKTFTWRTDVNITSDVIKGLNCQLNLPLDPLRKDLGDSVSIDISRARSTSHPTVPVEICTGQEFVSGAAASVAEVRQQTVNYTGHFSCQVLLKGKVILQQPRGNEEVNIVELCDHLRTHRSRELREALGGLQVERSLKGVIFNLQGTVTFRGDHENINWLPAN